MKKMKILLFAFLMVAINLSAQTPLISATQINQVTSNYLMDGLDSDINDQFYAILYWTDDNSSNTTTYMNVYDASTYTLIGSPITIVTDYPEIARVEIDDNNRIYVLYESNDNAYMKSYDVVATSVSYVSTVQVATHSGNYNIGGETVHDLSLCTSSTNSRPLVATKRHSPNQNQHELVVKVFDSGLNLQGEQMIVQNLPVSASASIAIDGNGDHYAVTYTNQTTNYTEFRRYDISNPIPEVFSFSSTSYAPQFTYNGGSVSLSSELIALKQDGKVLYIEEASSSNRLVEIDFTAQTRSVLLNDVVAVDVATNDNYVVTDAFEMFEMYDNTNSYLHAYTVDGEISNPDGSYTTPTPNPGPFQNAAMLREFSIHSCQLLVGGRHGIDWSIYPSTSDYQLYYQLFSPEVPCDSIIIDIPDTISMCAGFEPICGPVSYGCDVYSYFWTDPNGNSVATINECFTPSMYGDYILTVSVNGKDCTKKHYFNVSNEGKSIALDDVYYCKDTDGLPTLIGFDNLTGSQGIVEFIWTYENGTPFSSGTNPQINYIGDGQYCVQVIWEDECISETCFNVLECCEPNVNFTSQIKFTFKGGYKVIVGPGQGAGAPGIIAEQFVLYEYCDLKHTMPACNSTLWNPVSTITGNPTITGNVQFPYSLNTSCAYKVVYSVTSECTGETYESCQIVYYPQSFYPALSPNPTASGNNATLSITADSPQSATVEIRDVHTSNLIYTGELSTENPIELNSKDLRIQSGVYLIQIYNDDHSETLRWVIE